MFLVWELFQKQTFKNSKLGLKFKIFQKSLLHTNLGRKMRFFCFGHFFDISHSNGEKCTDRFWEGGGKRIPLF